jgi:amino acid transporter
MAEAAAVTPSARASMDSPGLTRSSTATMRVRERLSRDTTPNSRSLSRASSAMGTSSTLPVFGSGEEQKATKGKKKKLGMFKGVLVPTCENMWGVIIFLRFYVIVGYAGLGYTIFIVTLSFSVALLTALALSAIATCGTSHSLAGVYPMLARALGKEIATATGLVYFLGIVCLAVLECLGACEELFQVAPELADVGGVQPCSPPPARAAGHLMLLLCSSSTRASPSPTLCGHESLSSHLPPSHRSPLSVCSGARLWGFIFLSALSLMVGGGIKIVSAIGSTRPDCALIAP